MAVHAIRNLARIGRGTTSVRYSQLGFGRTSSTSTTQETPRNLMGFKDGTDNLKAEDPAALNSVRLGSRSRRPGLDGRRQLSRLPPDPDADRTVGLDPAQRAGTGHRPAEGHGRAARPSDEFDPIDFTSIGPDGKPLVDAKAHVRLAHPEQNNGAKILRRGYSFVDGTDGLGRLNAGLFFLAYQRDPRKGFVQIQTNLAGKAQDNLNEYIQHVGSGLWAVPPGVQPGGYWGQSLLA